MPPSQLAPEEAAKVTAAAATIAHLRSIKDRVPIAALLNAALDRTGYDAILLAEFLGERKLANLHKLIERARLADQSGAIDLDGFITQLSQFIAREPKESLAAIAAGSRKCYSPDDDSPRQGPRVPTCRRPRS